MGLSPFEGRDVISSGVEAPGAGGGFHKALAVDHMEKHHGETFTLAVEVEVTKVRHDPVGETGCLERVHVLKILNAAEIDEAVVAEALDAQRRRQEEAAGVKRLPLDDGDEPDAEG